MSAPTSVALEHRRLAYIPALDGLRAIAVLAVMAYHSGLGWLPGGFLGVDLFFAISGYLITTLLIREWEATGGIDLVAFWGRRARRLLPALLLVLIAVAIYALVVADPAGLARIRGDGLASLGYVANWRFIYSDQSYFEAFGAPSPLRHMWSLAVEEQWYLLWPLVMAVGLRRAKGRTLPLLAVTAAAALTSAAIMAALYTPFKDPSRAYYGTDARAHTLLVGAILAFVLGPGGLAPATIRRTARRWRVTAHFGGTVAAVTIVGTFLTVDDTHRGLYRGGFLLFAAGAALVIAAAVVPGPNLVKSVLSPRPLQAVGRISYGLYLWHWPVNIFLTPERAGVSGVGLALLRTAVTFAFAAVSFVIVERPVRLGRVRLARPVWAAAGSVAITALVLLLATVGARLDRGGEGPDAAGIRIIRPTGSTLVPATAGPSTTPATSTPATPAAHVETGPIITARPQPDDTPPATSPQDSDPLEVMIVGDSVGYSLARQAPPIEGMQLATRGAMFGCSFMDGDLLTGSITIDHVPCDGGDGPDADDPDGADLQPDLALVSVGAWEVYDRRVDGRNVRFDSAEHGRMMRAAFQREVDQLVADGVDRIAFLNVPCFREKTDYLGGTGSDRNKPERVAAVNDVLLDLVRANPTTVALIDIASFACPQGRYRATVDGVELRPDGVHYSRDSGPVVWRWLAPAVLDLASRARL